MSNIKVNRCCRDEINLFSLNETRFLTRQVTVITRELKPPLDNRLTLKLELILSSKLLLHTLLLTFWGLSTLTFNSMRGCRDGWRNAFFTALELSIEKCFIYKRDFTDSLYGWEHHESLICKYIEACKPTMMIRNTISGYSNDSKVLRTSLRGLHAWLFENR